MKLFLFALGVLGEASKLSEVISTARVSRMYSGASRIDVLNKVTGAITPLHFSENLKKKIICCVSAMYDFQVFVTRATKAMPRVVRDPKKWKSVIESFVTLYEALVFKLVSYKLLTADEIHSFLNEVALSKKRVKRVSADAFTTVGRARVLGVETLMISGPIDLMMCDVWLKIAEAVKGEGGDGKATCAALSAFTSMRFWNDAIVTSSLAFKREFQFYESVRLIMKSQSHADRVIRDYSKRETSWGIQECHSKLSVFAGSLLNSCISHCYENLLSSTDAVDRSLILAENVHSELLAEEETLKKQVDKHSNTLRDSLDNLKWYSNHVELSHLDRFNKLSGDVSHLQRDYLKSRVATVESLDVVFAKISEIVSCNDEMNMVD